MANDLTYDRNGGHIAAAVVRPRTLLAKVFDLIPQGARVLDVGCHTGKFAAFLRQKQCTVSGIEVNPSAAAVAAQLLDQVVVGDIEDSATWSQVAGSFDVIMFLDVLEHCRRPEAVLGQARGRLAAGGFLLTSLPNIAHWSIRKALLGGRFEYQETGILDQTHLRFFTLASARQMFRKTGYRIDRMDYVLAMPKLFKQRIIPNSLANRFPGIFAYQMVIQATPDSHGLPAA